MAREMYKYLKMEIKKLLEKNQALQAENFANSVLMNELNVTNDRLQMENDRYVYEIKDMKLKFENDRRVIERTAEQKVNQIQEDCDKQLKQLREYMTIEINVAIAIKDKIINDNKFQQEKLKKFATLLAIPRLHFDYIEKHGVNQFVEFCEDIVKRERALQVAKEAEKEKLNLRQK
mmetsp:Transcript_17288/g.26674  ORF Transcript_17288/g.26674 Transcript_17288/m.26674 type:complete len:176 (+) Transcript_17288:254-781(+)